VADPYATRSPDLSGRPEGPPPWEGEVTSRGGVIVGPAGELGERAAGGDPALVVVPCRGIGTLAPLARVDAPTAVLLWLEHAAEPRSAAAANELLVRVGSLAAPLLAIKHGSVAGPADHRGCTQVGADLIAAVLAALPEVVWERDPDFGYEVPSSVPGLGDPESRVLLPRLLYADYDRVYEHASLVAERMRERHELATAIDGLDARIIAASGWPPAPTGNRWRD
jgi:hypothetical protein